MKYALLKATFSKLKQSFDFLNKPQNSQSRIYSADFFHEWRYSMTCRTPKELMMKKFVIWKFELNGQGLQEVMMPQNAQILYVGMHKNQRYVWAIVNPKLAQESRKIEVKGTGCPFREAARNHISSFEAEYGGVYHAFEFLD